MKASAKINTILFHGILLLFLCTMNAGCKKDDAQAKASDARDNYVGTWRCTEKSSVGNQAFLLTISKDPNNQTYLRFYNFNMQGPNFFVNGIANYANLSIPLQQPPSGGNTFNIEGSGQLLNNQLNLSYTVNDGVNPNISYTAVCVK